LGGLQEIALSLLAELSGHPEYVALLRRAEQMKPELPTWDRAADNTDEWKEKSAQRQGFENCLAIFTPQNRAQGR
jgi:hypothetical protein